MEIILILLTLLLLIPLLILHNIEPKIETHELKCKKCGWKGDKEQAKPCYWDFEFASYFCGNKNCEKPIPD